MCAFISSSGSSSVSCPSVAPESRALWASFVGVVLGLHPSAESARAALPMLRALVALGHFVRAVFAVVEYSRMSGSRPDDLHRAAGEVLAALESELEENPDVDVNIVRAACALVFGTADVGGLVTEPWRFGADEDDARRFLTFAECALGLARSLDAPARETAAQG